MTYRTIAAGTRRPHSPVFQVLELDGMWITIDALLADLTNRGHQYRRSSVDRMLWRWFRDGVVEKRQHHDAFCLSTYHTCPYQTEWRAA